MFHERKILFCRIRGQQQSSPAKNMIMVTKTSFIKFKSYKTFERAIFKIETYIIVHFNLVTSILASYIL